MREIKFRAWDKELDRMLYDFDQNTPGVKLGQSIHLKVYETGLCFNTLMQYTGINDANGDPIYEGDIRQFKNGIGVVVWEDMAFAVKSPGSEAVDWEHSSVFINSTLLGNIYQNPELLP